MRQRIVLVYLCTIWQEVIVPLVSASASYLLATAFMLPITQLNPELVGVPGTCVLIVAYLLDSSSPFVARLMLECCCFYLLWGIAHTGAMLCYEERNCVPA